MNNLISINIHDPNNLGDQVCNPCDYFPELKNVPRVDAWEWPQWVEDTEHDIIFGGGGMVHGILVEALRRIKRVPNRKLIAWGLGHNQHGETTNDYAGCLDGFDLIGVRDYKRSQIEGWEYVPCPSCMNRWFGPCPIPPQDGCLIYAHYENPIILRGANHPIRMLFNDSAYLTTTIINLTSASLIVTNSYHGAYWSLLLGRQVSIYKPFSSRFYDFKHQPPFCDEKSWISGLQLKYPAYLDECRTLNRNFYEKVKQVLGIHDAGNDRSAVDHRDTLPAAPVSPDQRGAEGAD